MKVVIVGGAGFLGSYLVNELKYDHDVLVFDRVANPDVESHVGDYMNIENCLESLKGGGVDAVIHVAAISSPAYDPPELVFKSNVTGTFNVHEAARKLGIKKVISTSSEAAYGFFFGEKEFLPNYLPIDENHPLRPQDPYGLSKKVNEEIAQSFSDKGIMSTSVIRPPWIVKPEDYTGHKGFIAGRGFPLDKFNTFAYVDVRDLTKAFRLLLETDIPRYEIYNVCADDSTSNMPLSELLPKINPTLEDMAQSIKGNKSGLSNEKIKKLGWIPKFARR